MSNNLLLRRRMLMQAGGSPTPTPYNEPFYVEDLSGTQNNTLTIYKVSASAPDLTIEYSYDATTWVSMGSTNGTSYASPITAAIPFNGKVYLRCATNAWATNKINATNLYGVGGNIMSLLYGSNFTGNETVFPTSSGYEFQRLFSSGYSNEEINLLYGDCSKLLIPATTINTNSFWATFYQTNITHTPIFEASTVSSFGFRETFQRCYRLQKATILVMSGTFSNLFSNITTNGYLVMASGSTATIGVPTTWTTTTSDVSVEPFDDYSTPNEYLEPFYVKDSSSSNNTLSITGTNDNPISIEYSLDGNTWQMLGTTSTTALTLTITADSKVYLRASANTWENTKINCSAVFNVGGNITSLLYGNSFTGYEKFFPIPTGSFIQTFGSSRIKSAEALILPIITFYNRSYREMFFNCQSLIDGPLISCISVGFGWSYYNGSEFSGMFQYCSSLKSVKCLLKWYKQASTFQNWITSSQVGVLYKHPNSTIWVAGSNIPSTWTTQDYNV